MQEFACLWSPRPVFMRGLGKSGWDNAAVGILQLVPAYQQIYEGHCAFEKFLQLMVIDDYIAL
jgi:hypothetical protein